MADVAISGLTALGGAPATNDLLVEVDVSDTTQAPTGTTKKMTVANLFTSPAMTGPTVTSGGLTVTAGGLTVTAGGLTVSAGTTAVQALTATTGVFSGITSTTTGASTVGLNRGDSAAILPFLSIGRVGSVKGYIGLDASDNLAILTAAGTTANLTITDAGNVTIRGTVTMAAAVSKIIPGATSISHRNNADSADNLLISDAGAVTVRTSTTTPLLTISAGAGGTTTTSLTKINTASVSAATAITNAVGVGLSIVNGNDGSNFFKDIVSWGTAGATATTSTVSGGPAVRTYSVVAGQLKVAMASGTYTVETATFS